MGHVARMVEVQLSLCLTKYHVTTYVREEVLFREFLISTLDGGEWLASRSDA
jgi:hypothetical protein